MSASTSTIHATKQPNPRTLLTSLQQLRQEIDQEGRTQFEQWRPDIQRRAFLASGLNLSMYLALRRRDIRPLQVALTPWGLSSLGRSEARVLPNLDAVIATVSALVPSEDRPRPSHPTLRNFFRGERLLEQNVETLFGPQRPHRRVRIMTTLPTAAAHDGKLLRDLLKRGSDCLRINCAHDTSREWEEMISDIRKFEQQSGRTFKVLLELAGPKFRTGRVLLPDLDMRLHTGTPILLTPTIPVPDPDYPIQVECNLPEAFKQAQVGEQVWLNEGKIGTQVVARLPRGILLCITQARQCGEHLRPNQELNFPDTDLSALAALTAKDRQDLDFIVSHADIIIYPFVRDANDIKLLQQELRKRLPEQAPLPPLILKIETPRAVLNLPELLIQGAGQQPLGVMIARGNLAVELGYARMAEIQEEILWICEAAHVPVIWGTRVLENMLNKGQPSHAEMTDAVMAERAECVMLNKGPYLAETITLLDHLLSRIQNHQQKKTPQLRALKTWQKEKPELEHWL